MRLTSAMLMTVAQMLSRATDKIRLWTSSCDSGKGDDGADLAHFPPSNGGKF